MAMSRNVSRSFRKARRKTLRRNGVVMTIMRNVMRVPDDYGLMGSLAVWGLESSHENGLPVKWHDMSWFLGGPSQVFYITPPLR